MHYSVSLLLAIVLSSAFRQTCARAAESTPQRVVEQTTTVIETRRVTETQPPPQRQLRAAIFVNNTAGKQWNEKVLFLEDQITARIASPQLAIISREDSAKALKVYATETATKPAAENQDENATPDRNTLGTRVDRALSDQQTAHRLAEALGADFVVMASIGSIDKNVRRFRDDSLGVDTVTTTQTLRGSYKILDASSAGALAGDPLKSSRSLRQTANAQTSNEDIINELLDDAATQVAATFRTKADRLIATSRDGKIEISIQAQARDLAGNEIGLPDLRVTEDNHIVGGQNPQPLFVSAMIEIDGLASGTTPTSLKVSPGLHKLRVTRPAMVTYEATFNAEPGLKLTPTLVLSDEGLKRWQEIRTFLFSLDRARALTDAEVERIKGFAQMLRQSGYRVDAKSDIKVNTTEGIKVDIFKSLF